MAYIYDGIEFKGITSKSLILNPSNIGNRERAQELIYSNPVMDTSMEYDEHTDIYIPYSRKMSFHILDKSKKAEVHNWLRGNGILRTANDEGGFFKASVTTGLDNAGAKVEKFDVTFKINPPFFYLDKGQIPITYTANPTESIFNPGTYKSEPIIKVYGSGNIILNCNKIPLTITGLQGGIILNSEIKKAYMDLSDLDNKVLGTYPTFEVGHNFISWTGNVTKVVIVPNWREL